MAATSSRQSALFGLNDWKTIYSSYNQDDLKSYNYETLRKSFIDYLQTYYPESFNDYVESSEYVALLDLMAFMGQGLAFRDDLNARENFIDTAERRDSVTKLANLVSYTPKRNNAGQGFLKVVSVSTTQNINDINGLNLSNVPVLWNDPANPNWLEQFNTIINATLIPSQKIGKPGNVSTIQNVTNSEYSIQIPSGTLPVVPFTSSVDGNTMNFELCSVTSVNKDYIYELPPEPNEKFNILYRNDKLGYGSPQTGFFFYFKQGSLKFTDFSFQNQIANQFYDINLTGINETDTWLYQMNSDGTRNQWHQVESVYADAYKQKEDPARKLFSVKSRANDQVTYTFGDGVLSTIPIGNFRAYVRTSNALTYTIDPSEMSGVSVSFTYVSRLGRTETITFGLELPLVVNSAKSRETIDDIKLRAPSRYYTQNRMVNGEDYNNFPYTLYNSIIKSKAINRSSVGVSKNLDLLDPTGKYSSTNSFGSDGALYQIDTDSFLSLVVNNTSDIISFFTDTLASVLSQNRTNQYYIQNYTRYNIDTASGDGTVYWKISTVNSGSETGYLYTVNGSLESPVSVGTFNSNNLKYLTTGSIVKFIAPAGYYFNKERRLKSGIPGQSDTTYIWSTILNVSGDGSNNGNGTFSNGTGPIKLSNYVPDGAIISSIIPVFGNAIPTAVIQESILRIELNQDFTLVFDNSLLVNQERWSVGKATNPNYFVKFTSLGSNRYSIAYRSLVYNFASVADTRFTFSNNELVYDPFSGKIIQDYISILGINTIPGTNVPIGQDTRMNILGQTVESDGYVNDFVVEVATTDLNNNQLIMDPDFFNTVTGYVTGGSNIGTYVFFETIQDPLKLTRNTVIPTEGIMHQYATKEQVEVVKYDYPVGQLFYAYSDNVFFKSEQVQTVTTPYYILVEQPQYSVLPGRQGFSYQYRHNSNNMNRIDPVTTNIIDMYLVTFSYYTQYTKYIQDSTGTIKEPAVPTITELTQAYGNIQDYKMLSDSTVLNSVVFKPLFGNKADVSLRGTIKVIRAAGTNASDSEIRSSVLSAMNEYFNINNWDFGDTFYFSELSAFLHSECGDLISSAVLVPNDPNKAFGDLYEIKCMPYEVFVNAATANDVQVVSALTSNELQIG